jgi:hypothetical protein
MNHSNWAQLSPWGRVEIFHTASAAILAIGTVHSFPIAGAQPSPSIKFVKVDLVVQFDPQLCGIGLPTVELTLTKSADQRPA